MPISANMVVKNSLTSTTERTPLSIVSCSQIQDKLDELKLKIKPGEFLEYQDCLVFPKGSLIGRDSSKGIKRTIEIEVNPCLTGCYSHTFPMIGPQEITPLNSFPFFPVYPAFMHQFNYGYQLVLHYMNTVTDFENYDEPTSTFLGLPEEFQFSLQKEQIATISFEQVYIKTYDGYFKRSLRDNRATIFKNSIYRNKIRTPTDRFQLIEIQLTDDVIEVERVYPNVIDLCSDIGSILKVLVFFCVATGMIHNQIRFDQYLLNAVFKAEEFELGKNPQNHSAYSYLQIFKLKCCCQKKDSPIKKKFEANMQVIAERMDMWHLVKRSQNTKFFTKAFLKPYQIEIFSKHKAQNDCQIKKAQEMGLELALMELRQSIEKREGDSYSQKIDEILSKLIADSDISEQFKNRTESLDNQARSSPKLKSDADVSESNQQIIPKAGQVDPSFN